MILHIRWQGGACEDRVVDLPLPMSEKLRYPNRIVEKVRGFAKTLFDKQIATALNAEGVRSPTGKIFTVSMIKWIRYRHKISTPQLKRQDELTVKEVAKKFGIRSTVVYSWIEHGLINARRTDKGMPYWITIEKEKERGLWKRIHDSGKLSKKIFSLSSKVAVEGAV